MSRLARTVVADLPHHVTQRGNRREAIFFERYTNFINARGRWTGHLFQSRFASVAMDELHLLAAVSYVSLNPVRAGLVGYAADWAWSSVRAHLAGKDNGLVTVRPVLDRVSCFSDLLLLIAGPADIARQISIRGKY